MILDYMTFKMSFRSKLLTAVQDSIGGKFPGGSVIKNLPSKAGDTGLVPGLGGSHMPQSS